MKFPVLKRFGDHAVLLEWPELISKNIQLEVRHYNRLIEDRYYREIVETVMTYQSIAVYLRDHIKAEDFIKTIEETDFSKGSVHRVGPTLVIPVCYDRSMAEDLEDICFYTGLSEAEVINLHTSVTYEVAFIGFLPGFAYLNGLPKMLHTPRKRSPRRHVPKGAVAIGGQQAGIYPMESPGGWNIVGRCPLELFDISKSPPCLLKTGDRLRFQEVSEPVFHEIASLSANGLYETQILES